MSHKLTAYVADGSLVSQHPDIDVERLLGRDIKWVANDDRVEVGSFFQQSYTSNITTKEAAKLMATQLENISIKRGASYIFLQS